MKNCKKFKLSGLLISLLLSGLPDITSNIAPAYARPARRHKAATVRPKPTPTKHTHKATPTDSPKYVTNGNGGSARAAALLKTSPPAGWVRHYLPEDRYKVAGGVWKYVSTENDQYYHHPSSREMLSQSPDNVIGFASAADAEEGGYLPGPSISDRDRQTGWIGGAPSGGVSRGSTVASSSSFTLSIPASKIPKGVLPFINLVDFIAGKIQNATSRDELTEIIVNTLQIVSDFHKGNTASYLQGQTVSRLDAMEMSSYLSLLVRAARNKRSPGVVKAIGLSASRQEISAARDGARSLIPQVARAKDQLMREQGPNLHGIMESYRKKTPSR